MTGTTFSEVYDNFTEKVKDYRLDALFNTSPTNFETYLSGFLIPAIEDFDVCDQSLAYSTSTFTETLTPKNIDILAKLMKKRWLEKEIADVKQFNLGIFDREYKRFAESNNMLAKQKMLILEMEEISQLLTNYSLKNSINWSEWYAGTYYTPT